MSTSERFLRHDPDIFISYQRTDREFVERLVPVLEGLGPSVWWDAEIGGGEDWRDSIVENLAASRCLVIVFSEACNTSKQLRKELAVADHLDKEVIPVLIEHTEPRGFFLYELAPLNWISIHPAPMQRLELVARLLVQRLEAVGWTAPPANAPPELAPPERPVRSDAGRTNRSSVPGRPAVPRSAPPVPPGAPDEADIMGMPTPPAQTQEDVPGSAGAPATSLSGPALSLGVPPGPSAGRAGPMFSGQPRQRLRDTFPFRSVDFVLPTVAGVLLLLFGREEGDDVGASIGRALFLSVTILAITGLILFPVRYYRQRSNPYLVARNLVISNLVFALVISLSGFLTAESTTQDGETVGETIGEARGYQALGSALIGLLIAAISFGIFVQLSRSRANKDYKKSIEQLEAPHPHAGPTALASEGDG